MIVDFRALSSILEPVAMPLPHLDKIDRALTSAIFSACSTSFCGCWQYPLQKSEQELFTMATLKHFFKPTNVPQGALNSTAYFHGVVTDMLNGLLGRLYLAWTGTESELLRRVSAELECLVHSDLVAAALKVELYRREVRWCGQTHSGDTVSHDPERVQRLVAKRRLNTARQFIYCTPPCNGCGARCRGWRW